MSVSREIPVATFWTCVLASPANVRAEQRVRALRCRGAEIFDHLVAQWAVRHAERPGTEQWCWILVRIFVRNRINDDKQPRFLVGLVTWTQRCRRHYSDGRWKHEVQRFVEVKSRKPQWCKRSRTSECTREDEKHKNKGASLSGVRTWNQCQCWSENTQLFVDKQFFKFDADGKVLTTETQNACDSHTNNLKLTDDAVAKRAKLCDTPSSNSSGHEIAPKVHVSFGGVEDSETRERVVKKLRVDIDMEISAVETLTNAKLEVDRALVHSEQNVASFIGRNSI